MGKRFPHDPASAQHAPNGATHFTSYSGARGALIQACPVVAHGKPLTVYATDRDGGACTRIRGAYVAGRVEWGAAGPAFIPRAGAEQSQNEAIGT